MPDLLGLAQVGALQRLLENHDSRTAIEAFCDAQFSYHCQQAVEDLLGKRSESAQEHAYSARCYRTMMNELKQFIGKQLER